MRKSYTATGDHGLVRSRPLHPRGPVRARASDGLRRAGAAVDPARGGTSRRRRRGDPPLPDGRAFLRARRRARRRAGRRRHRDAGEGRAALRPRAHRSDRPEGQRRRRRATFRALPLRRLGQQAVLRRHAQEDRVRGVEEWRSGSDTTIASRSNRGRCSRSAPAGVRSKSRAGAAARRRRSRPRGGRRTRRRSSAGASGRAGTSRSPSRALCATGFPRSFWRIVFSSSMSSTARALPSMEAVRAGLETEYADLARRYPKNPAYPYLLGRLEWNRKKSRELLERSVGLDPNFPWAREALVRSLSWKPTLTDDDRRKAREHLEAFARSLSDENRRAPRAARALRRPAVLGGARGGSERSDESGRRPAGRPEGPLGARVQVRGPGTICFPARGRVGAGRRASSSGPNSDRRWLSTLEEGYKLTGDESGKRWVEDAALAKFPCEWSTTRDVVRPLSEWNTANFRTSRERLNRSGSPTSSPRSGLALRSVPTSPFSGKCACTPCDERRFAVEVAGGGRRARIRPSWATLADRRSPTSGSTRESLSTVSARSSMRRIVRRRGTVSSLRPPGSRARTCGITASTASMK